MSGTISPRERLVDDLVRDCLAALVVIDVEDLEGATKDAAELLAPVADQDTEEGDDGVFRIAQRVAPDRVISTVDVEARHGHKSHARKFDGFKAHLSVDPDSELIDEVVVTPGNVHDAAPVADLLATHADDEEKPTVIGDCAYGTAETLERLTEAGYEDIKARVAPARGRDGWFGKEDFVWAVFCRHLRGPSPTSAEDTHQRRRLRYRPLARAPRLLTQSRGALLQAGRHRVIGDHSRLLARMLRLSS